MLLSKCPRPSVCHLALLLRYPLLSLQVVTWISAEVFKSSVCVCLRVCWLTEMEGEERRRKEGESGGREEEKERERE